MAKLTRKFGSLRDLVSFDAKRTENAKETLAQSFIDMKARRISEAAEASVEGCKDSLSKKVRAGQARPKMGNKFVSYQEATQQEQATIGQNVWDSWRARQERETGVKDLSEAELLVCDAFDRAFGV